MTRWRETHNALTMLPERCHAVIRLPLRCANVARTFSVGSVPFLVHQQLAVEVLVVAGRLDGVDELFGLDQLVAVPVHVVGLGHGAAAPRQRPPKVRLVLVGI